MRVCSLHSTWFCIVTVNLGYALVLKSPAVRLQTVSSPRLAKSAPNRICMSQSASPEAPATSLPRGGKPVREIENPKPRLWIYDHCPFCVRARMALGLKSVEHDLAFLSNDDVDTPSSMIGKKMVPILELGRPGSESHEVLAESLDIVRRVDEDLAFGPPVLAPASDRADLNEWLNSVAMVIRRLTYPRNAITPLPEFQTRSARDAYIRNHPLPEPKASYSENLQNSQALIEELERGLWALEPMIHSPECVSPPPSGDDSTAKMSYDDIVFFPKMRSLTIIRGLGIPPKLRTYLDTVSETCDIPL